MGNILGGSSQSTQSSNAPWSPQQGYLMQGFQQAQNVMNARNQWGPYPGGSLYSPMTDAQLAMAGQGSNYAFGTGQNLVNQTAGTAGLLQGASPTFMDNAASFVNGSNPVSGALQNNALHATQGMASTQGSLLQAIQNAQTNPTAATAANAQTYASNPYVQNAVKSVNSQIGQVLNEQTLPGLNQAASLGGTLNSSRAGAAQALAQEGAGIAMGNADSSIYNNAWNSGLSTAANQWATGLNAGITGSSLGYNDMSNAANATAGLQLSGNGQLGQAVSQGMFGAADAGSLANQNFQLGTAATAMPQQNQNAINQGAFNDWNYQSQFPQGVLQGYMQDITGNYGGTGSGMTTNSSSPLGNGIAMAGQLGSMFAPSGVFGGLGSLGQSAADAAAWGNTAASGSGVLGSVLSFLGLA